MKIHSTIRSIDKTSFRVAFYTPRYFRMIGLIDVQIAFEDLNEKVTLAFYRSSGTNSDKIKGLWYPIVGIKLFTGAFVEFTPTINEILKATSNSGDAHSGWLAKSLFFPTHSLPFAMLRGFGEGPYYKDLFALGKTLQKLYEANAYNHLLSLQPPVLNHYLTADQIYPGNKRTQQQNFETFMQEIYSLSFLPPHILKID